MYILIDWSIDMYQIMKKMVIKRNDIHLVYCLMGDNSMLQN